MKKNNSNIFWHGWKTEAANHFNVTVPTIMNWFNANNEELLTWLKDKIIYRYEEEGNKQKQKMELINLAKGLINK